MPEIKNQWELVSAYDQQKDTTSEGGKKKGISCIIIESTVEPTESVAHPPSRPVCQQTSQRRQVTQELSWEMSGAPQAVEEGWLFTVKGATCKKSSVEEWQALPRHLRAVQSGEDSWGGTEPVFKSHLPKIMAWPLPPCYQLRQLWQGWLVCLTHSKVQLTDRENTHVCPYIISKSKSLMCSNGELSQRM